MYMPQSPAVMMGLCAMKVDTGEYLGSIRVLPLTSHDASGRNAAVSPHEGCKDVEQIHLKLARVDPQVGI